MSDHGPSTSAAERALAAATWQPALLAPRPRRLDLLRLQPAWPLQPVRVTVHRNQPFELVTQTWAPFLAAAGLQPLVRTGPYDDTLAAADPGTTETGAGGADLEVVSLDFDRYRTRSADELAEWVLARVSDLSARARGPVLVTDWPSGTEVAARFNALLASGAAELPSVAVAGVDAVRAELGDDFTDARSAAVTGTTWSADAVVAMAREFGLRWVPALVLPVVKAVVVDLDATLYDGVLAEDGVAGVRLTPGHRRLQQHLADLSAAGVLVAVASRNEPADVEELFAVRDDFPLRRDRLSAVAASWGAKADSIAAVAEQLHIGLDAVAFLDDNPGELAAVASALPAVRTLHAADPELSLQALRYCPGLHRFARRREDGLRVADLAAAARRTAAAARSADPEEYLRSLQAVLGFSVDQRADLARLAELSAKTNQFNVARDRFSERDLARRLEDGSLRAVAVSLRDRLSDSGTVASVLGRREGARLVVEEICISCRALGRGIEDPLIAQSLLLLGGDGVEEVEVRYAAGPRNAPALGWLERFCGAVPDGSGSARVPWRPVDAAASVTRAPFDITVDTTVDRDPAGGERP